MGGLGGKKTWRSHTLWIPTPGFSKAENFVKKVWQHPRMRRTYERFWRTVRSTPFQLPRPIIGTASCPSGPAKPARRLCRETLKHNLFEGRKLVEAAKKYGRIVQHGTQNRSLSKWSDLAKEIASGKRGNSKWRWEPATSGVAPLVKETKTPPSELNLTLGPDRLR